jgi:hypothetical protein
MDGIEVVASTAASDNGSVDCYRSGESTRLAQVQLDPGFVVLLDDVGNRWRSRPLRELLEHVDADEGFARREFGDSLF